MNSIPDNLSKEITWKSTRRAKKLYVVHGHPNDRDTFKNRDAYLRGALYGAKIALSHHSDRKE